MRFHLLHLASAVFVASNATQARTTRNLRSSSTNARRRLCKITFDCPQPACDQSPCERNYCEDGVCSLPVDDNQASDRNDEHHDFGDDIDGGYGILPMPHTTICSVDSDCPPVNCLIDPCDVNKCQEGVCVLEPEVGENNNFLDDADPGGEGEESGNHTLAEGSIPCGPVFCNDDQVCCNESCGICTEEFGICSDVFCGGDDNTNMDGIPEDAETEECGTTTCQEGEVCCNPSCGICTPPNGVCTMQLCSSTEEDTPQDDNDADDEGGNWITVNRGDCDCQELCSVCQQTFGICIKLYCFP